MNTLNRRKFKRAGMYALIILSVVILAFPLYWMIVTSLTTRSALLENISILPKLKNITSSNFMKILDSQPILTWFGNSIFVTAFSTIIAITVSTMAAYSMSRYKYKSTNFLGFFLLVVRMLPETLLVVPLYMMFTHMKLINNYASLIISQCHLVKTFSIYFPAVLTFRTAIFMFHKTIEMLHFPQTRAHNGIIHL